MKVTAFLLLLLLMKMMMLVLLSTGKKFRWCTLSDGEQRKCSELSRALLAALPPATLHALARVACIRAHNTYDCMEKIRANKADAASLDAGDVYSAVRLYGLRVVAKEIYGEGHCVFAVAAARRRSLDIHRLRGTRSCHGAAKWTSGWSIPLGFLLVTNNLLWGEDQPLSHAIGGYFNASCIPGVGITAPPQLCALCQGQKSYFRDKNHFCETGGGEPFFSSEGAFSGVADVAFLDHLAVLNATESEREEFELLCPDGSTASLTAYATCNLGRGPGRAVVTRPNFQAVARKFLTLIQFASPAPPLSWVSPLWREGQEKGRFALFASDPFRGKNLLFHDATTRLQVLDEDAEISCVLGLDYLALLQGLGHEGSSLSNSLVRWCCISDAELRKCEEWALSVRWDPLVCIQADSMVGCITMIKKNEADAVTLDATHAYFAERCGLVPVAAECYGEECGPTQREEGTEQPTNATALPPLYAIAVVKKASKPISIFSLRGKRSCHSHEYSPGGWLLLSQYTVGGLENDSVHCSLTSAYQGFFWKGCMPGTGAGGNLCKVCLGQKEAEGGKTSSRCAANHNERYYGNLGALRCLFGDPSGRSFGDVAFLEHHNLLQNIEYLESSGWAAEWGPGHLELLCPDGSRAPVTSWRACHLGHIPPGVIATRPMAATKVHHFLAKAQEPSASSAFQLFQSQRYGESDLLFRDATRHLILTGHLGFKALLGEPFLRLAESVFGCTPAGILDFCEQDPCREPTWP
ncbi:hypothetical protein JRQ81_008005 [Phrynocephalus forsythii]|uniref:Transferrin-like domain-containing protein n=1 Tax=Phrynocephalus forsythii TaxID=171643 RepID=A0A9Q0XDH2_9SAUR|nr:hypothetical protein JRQ81_008005 [Phrynocephalus forsythii]